MDSELSIYISYQESGYSMHELDKVKIICYDNKINVPQSLSRCVVYLYHFYLNHPGGIRLLKITRRVWYWKDLISQVDLLYKTCKICQKFKKRKTVYGHLPPNKIAELKLCNTVHLDLIGLHRK